MPAIAKYLTTLCILAAAVAALAISGCGPTGPDTLTQQAAVEYHKGEIDRAQAHLQGALAFEPSNPEALLYMGRVCEAQGKLEMALFYYQSAIDAKPGNKPAQAALHQVQAELGQTGKDLQIVPSPQEGK